MSGDATTPTTSTTARGPLVLALSDLRAHYACDLDERVRAYCEHHGREPDDASTLRAWLAVTPDFRAWMWATRCLGLVGRRLGLAVATAAARRALARVEAAPRSVQAVEAAEAVLEAYRRGVGGDDLARLIATAAYTATAAAFAAYAAADAAADAAALFAARAAAADAAAYAGVYADSPTSAIAADLAQQRQDFLAELDQIEGGSL